MAESVTEIARGKLAIERHVYELARTGDIEGLARAFDRLSDVLSGGKRLNRERPLTDVARDFIRDSSEEDTLAECRIYLGDAIHWVSVFYDTKNPEAGLLMELRDGEEVDPPNEVVIQERWKMLRESQAEMGRLPTKVVTLGGAVEAGWVLRCLDEEGLRDVGVEGADSPGALAERVLDGHSVVIIDDDLRDIGSRVSGFGVARQLAVRMNPPVFIVVSADDEVGVIGERIIHVVKSGKLEEAMREAMARVYFGV